MSITTESFETFLSAGKRDDKGREIGYIVGLRTVKGVHYAWVQNARRVSGLIKDFGASQPSKPFKAETEARDWAYATAKARIAKLKEAA